MQNLSLGESQNISMTHPGWACKFLLGNHKREMKTTGTPEARDTFKHDQSQAETFLDCHSYTNFTILTEEIPGPSLKMQGQEYWHLVSIPLWSWTLTSLLCTNEGFGVTAPSVGAGAICT